MAGLNIKLQDLFKGIFGKKDSGSDTLSKLELQRRADELGISPESYLAIINGGSIYSAVGDGDWGADYNAGNLTYDNYSLDAVLENTMNKYKNYGSGALGALQEFGLNDSYARFNTQARQASWDNRQAIEQSGDAQYSEALGEVQDVQGDANRQNRAAQLFLNQATGQANAQQQRANAAVDGATSEAARNNADAARQTNETEVRANSNNEQARFELEEAEESASRGTEAASASLESARTQKSEKDKQAQEKIDTAQKSKNDADQLVTDLTTQISTLDSQIKQLEGVSELSEEDQIKLESLRKQKTEAEQKLTEAETQAKKAEEELEKAKSEQTQISQEGEQNVQAQQDALNAAQKQGQEAVRKAQDNVARVERQGNESISKAKANAASVDAKGQAAVTSQQQSAAAIQSQGQQSVTQAKQNVKATAAQGEKDVKAAKAEAADVRDEVRRTKSVADDVYYHSSEYRQKSNGVVPDMSDIPVTDNAGNRAKIVAEARARENNPGVDEAKVREAAKSELAGMMRKTDAQRKGAVQQCFTNPPSKAKLAKAAADRYDSEVQQGNSTRTSKKNEDLLPDGDMNNNMHLQGEIGNCWAQAAVTSLASTPEGAEMLATHMYRDASRGVTSVHLQEAENNGNGAGGSGIYTFTDKEIIEASKRFGTGDGDITAYMLATEKYFQENPAANSTRSNGSAASEGATNNRMYEVLTGAKAEYTANSGYVNIGLNRFVVGQDDNGQDFNDKYSYAALCKAVQQGHTAGNLTVAATNGNSHSFSIVGVSENGTLLVQEPNNRGFFNEMFTFTDKDGNTVKPFKRTTSVNGKPTYECSRETYQKYIRSGTIMRWK